MRVSSDSDRQTTDLQRDALLSAGVDSRHLFEDHASGAKDDRCGLAKALEFVKSSDVLVVWKLDRLGRSLSHLLSIVNELKDKQAAFRSLTEGMDTTTASGELLFEGEHPRLPLAQRPHNLNRCKQRNAKSLPFSSLALPRSKNASGSYPDTGHAQPSFARSAGVRQSSGELLSNLVFRR